VTIPTAATRTRRNRTPVRRIRTAAVGVVAALALAGCAPTVSLDPAPDAANADCAAILVRLPGAVAGAERRDTDAQATAAWGSPASVILHCGVPVPGPTTDRCISIDDVDWVEDASRAPVYTYTAYGRDPATQVTIDTTEVSGSTALVDVTAAVGVLPAQGACVGAEDVG
jgi:hypothetical protein